MRRLIELLSVGLIAVVCGTLAAPLAQDLFPLEVSDLLATGTSDLDGTVTIGGDSGGAAMIDPAGNADFDGTLNVDGAVTFAAWRDAGVMLPFRNDADPNTVGLQCPDGMSRVTDMDGLYLIGVTDSGTLGNAQTTGYGDSDLIRRGGSGIPAHGHAAGGLGTASSGSHEHGTGLTASTFGIGLIRVNDFLQGSTAYELTTSTAGVHSHGINGTTASGGASADQLPPAPARQVLWCEFN